MVTVTLNPAIDHTVAIPGFRANGVNRVSNEQRTAGGKGINVSSFLADYGIPSVVTGFLGRTNAGLFESHFAAKDLEDRFVRVDGENRVNLKILNHADNEVTDINFPGLRPTADDQAKLESVLGVLGHEHDWFVLSGSLPLSLPCGTYASLVAMLRHRRRKVLLDVSGEALRQALKAQPTAIKPNARELEEALNRPLSTPSDLIKAAGEILQSGVECVVISRGAAGALFMKQEEALSARYLGTPSIQTTVGAGDALVAGFLAASLDGLNLDAAARLAIAFSISALQRTGTVLAPRPDLLKLAEFVEVRSLD